MGPALFVMKKILFLCLAACCIAGPLHARRLSIGNDDFRSELLFRDHRFLGASFLDVKTGECLTADAQAPLFELCLEGQKVTSADPVWAYAGRTRKTLANGGTVISFSFRGRGAWRGLRLVWDREFFPEGAFVRERLRLRSARGKGLHLTNLDGGNHLLFPVYAFAEDGAVQAKELRIGTFRKKHAFPEHHMFHTDSSRFTVGASVQEVKGPFLILSGPRRQWVCSYEHASQDHSFNYKPGQTTAAGNDESQGVEGDIMTMTDDDFWFISSFVSQSDGTLWLGNRIRHGGYLDGEAIPSKDWYETVWSTLSILPSDANVNAAISDYLLTKITENPESRVADFYYNSWGMQR